MICPECQRDFPPELINPLVTHEGQKSMCPLCGLTARNKMAGLSPDTPFEGRVARGMFNAALVHLARVKAQEN